MRGLNPEIRGETVRMRVFNKKKNSRLVRRLRSGRSYGGCTTIDVVGCDMRCSYCYVDGSFLDGKGEMLEREKTKGTLKEYTPSELVNYCLSEMAKNNWPQNVQITAAEPFLTPFWLFDVIKLFGSFMDERQKFLWVDTNGFALVRCPDFIDLLLPFKHFLRLFVSSKNEQNLYTAMTRVDVKYCDTGFKCLELLWEKGISAFLQAPITELFSPESFDWYFERLSKIHTVAPLLLDLDRLCYLPFGRIRKGLGSTGLWTKRISPKVIEQLWKELLEKRYGRKIKRLISVDSFPEDERFVRELVFDYQPIESCRLFS